MIIVLKICSLKQECLHVSTQCVHTMYIGSIDNRHKVNIISRNNKIRHCFTNFFLRNLIIVFESKHSMCVQKCLMLKPVMYSNLHKHKSSMCYCMYMNYCSRNPSPRPWELSKYKKHNESNLSFN